MDYPGKVIRKTPVTSTQASASGVWTVDDALQAVKTNTWPIAGVPNPISRSLRFNSADSAYLNRTPASAGNRRTWTWSGWVKRSALSTGYILDAGTGPNTGLLIGGASDVLSFFDYTSGPTYNFELITTQSFRDVSAWYHIVVAVDTTQATSSNRVKIYLNGSQITAFGTATYPSQNFDTGWNNATAHRIGSTVGGASYFNGYLADINFIDGSALTPSDFGLTDPQTGAWIPKKYTGTYGTNGFYVNFKDNSSTGTLGYDYSGNSNNWTANNFSVTAGAGNDSLTDVPTPWIAYNTSGDTGGIWRGNYNTLNPLDNNGITLANGNLDASSSANSWKTVRGSIGMSSGKWYWEFTSTASDLSDNFWFAGIANAAAVLTTHIGANANGWGFYSLNGNKNYNNVSTSYGNSWQTNDVIGIAFDADAGKIWFAKNGTWQASGNPASGTNEAYSSIPAGTYFPAISPYSGDGSATSGVANFGQRPFAYTPPAGFLSLCTTNLPTPTIGATSTTQAGKYFNIITWSGTNGARTFTGVGFQPDFVWGKLRNGSGSHQLYDAVRGTGASKALASNVTDAEGLGVGAGSPALYGYLSAFTSDGFSVADGTDPNPSLADAFWNDVSNTYVAWNWNAGGSNQTISVSQYSSNVPSIASTVRASTTAGFSVVTYTGNNTLAQSVGHGLGAAPSMIIVKSRSNATNWLVWHSAISINSVLLLNDTSAEITGLTGIWGSALPTSTTFGLNRLDTDNNRNGQTYVAYCFAPIAGYSAFGSYTGNDSSDGTFVYTGFRPKYVLVKNISATSYWQINDTARNPYNLANLALHPNTSGAEATYSNAVMDILSNGFKLRGNDTYTNTNGNIYIYAAFAESPFKFSNAR